AARARSPSSAPIESQRARTPSSAASDGVPTAQRAPHLTAPMTSRSGSGAAQPAPHSSGVVMSRPAVIVGAPAKPPSQPMQKVRKAREDEGRGFGHGLISEKSLDEVILAY